MSQYLNIPIRCPACGNSDAIISHGMVNTDGLDPLMGKYECKHETIICGEGEHWMTVIDRKVCGTVFYISPIKPLTESQKKQVAGDN